MNKINIIAEYEPVQIRHAVIQCPYCKNWFNIADCTSKFNWTEGDLYYNVFQCPKCEETFSTNNFELNIKEEDYSMFPKTLKKKVEWV